MSYPQEKITPNQLRTYLSSKSWIEDDWIGDAASIWHRAASNEQEYEVLLPEKLELRDFSIRMKNAIESIAEYEKRSIDDIVKDAVNISSDIISIRIIHTDVDNGTIPLEDGIELIKKARELLISSTLSTLSKKKYHPSKSKKDVSDFMSKARLGQTEIGSYVINLIAPIPPNEQNNLVNEHSLTRKITKTLAESLKSLRESIDDDFQVNFDTLDSSVADGVSANLCDALIGLSGNNNTRDFEVSLTFSDSEPEEDITPKAYRFKAKAIPAIQQASEYLQKDDRILRNEKISGIVKKLERSEDEQEGIITITAQIEGRPKTVSIELSPEEYSQAIHAHENKQPIECIGDVYIKLRSAKLLNCRGFRVLERENSNEMLDFAK